MKKLLILTFLFFGFFKANTSLAQQPVLKELHVGDQIPDIKLSGLYADTNKVIDIKELYRGKVLILDFWGTWCGACITGFKHFAEVKKEVGDKIEIVAVGYEPFKKIDGLFKRQPELLAGSDIVLTNEKILTRKLFPHRLLPHIAWINSDGKVIAITAEEDVTAENIKNVLAGRSVDAPEKKDAKGGLDVIFKPFRLMDTAFIGRSILTSQAPGYPSFDGMQGANKEEPTKLNRIFICNQTIRDLYTYALFREHISSLNFTRVLLEVKDSLKYVDPSYAPQSYKKSKYKRHGDWEKDNLYCYELKVPERTEDTILRNRMLNDLNMGFNLDGKFLPRYVDCYKLTYTKPDREKIKNFADSLKSTTNLKKVVEKTTTFNNFIDFLNTIVQQNVVINETGLPGNSTVNVMMPQFEMPMEKLLKIIGVYGFKLEPVKRTIPVFVITEK